MGNGDFCLHFPPQIELKHEILIKKINIKTEVRFEWVSNG